MNPSINKEGFTLRPLAEGDDLDRVARLIYLTDDYVYPNWFDSVEDGVRVLREMISLPTLYNAENITVAVTDGGEVAGIAISKMTPFTESREVLSLAFERAGVTCDGRTDFVFREYYGKMGEPEDGYYIANIAVDEGYRRRGIATALTKKMIDGRDFCTLECVIANAGAWRVYQSVGFRIAYEYPGVHGVPCYKMVYRRGE